MSPSSLRVLALHKPRGVICSRVPEGGADTVFSILPHEYQDFTCVGRLDKESEGLLLFCNGSRWAQRFMDPGGLEKVYRVTVRGNPRDEELAFMTAGGLELDGRSLLPVGLRRLGKAPRGGTRFEVVLHEGVNREIRRLFASAGFKVRKLVRVRVGTVELGELLPGEVRELRPEEIGRLTAHLEKEEGLTARLASH